MDIINLDKLNWNDSEEVIINNEVTSAIIEDASETLNYFADKYIITKYPITTGTLVEYEGIVYLIISQIDRNKNNYKARIRQADFSISLLVGVESQIIGYDGLGRPIFESVEVYEDVNCIVEQGSIRVESGIINLPYNQMQVTMQKNEFTEVININDEFQLFNRNWRVMGIDNTKLGLIILHVEMK